MDAVQVKVEVDTGVVPEDTDLAARVAERIKNTIGLSMDISLQAPGSIPRSQGGKLSRVVDIRMASE